MALHFEPATAERWPDIEELFGPRGAFSGCWCAWWLVKRSEFDAIKAAGRKALLRDRVESGEPPGLVAYDGAEPVAWVAVNWRETYGPLQRSRTLKPLPDQPPRTMSIVCFFVAENRQGKGMTAMLIAAAIDYSRAAGADAIEGYPVEQRDPKLQAGMAAYMGTRATFERAGFTVVVKRGAHPIMRLSLG
jgi:GNAT superfamily N-acetyltransferase